jgi:DNA-binding transcriptional LysR family regulator
MYEGPEFRQLRYFVAVAEFCNFSKAAQRLHVSQPSLSAQIKQLEDGLNAKLFVRSPTGTFLTRAGHSFHAKAKQMLALRQRAVEDTSIIHAGTDLPLRFGYSPFVSHDLVREVLKVYQELVPAGRLDPSSESSPALSKMVSEAHLDAALVTLPLADQELFVQPICTEKLMVCLRIDDPLAQQESLSRTDVQRGLKIVASRTHHPLLYEQIIRNLTKGGITLLPSYSVSSSTEMQFLVKMKLGFGLVRESAEIDPELTKRPITGLDLRIKTAFICHVAQQRPLYPILVYRLAQACSAVAGSFSQKKPNQKALLGGPEQIRLFG